MAERLHLPPFGRWRVPDGAVIVAAGRGHDGGARWPRNQWANPFRWRTHATGMVRAPGVVTGAAWEFEHRAVRLGPAAPLRPPLVDAVTDECTVRWATRAELVELYWRALLRIPDRAVALGWPPALEPVAVTVAQVRAELAGRDLACTCAPSEACHADVLLLIAAGSSTSRPAYLDDPGPC